MSDVSVLPWSSGDLVQEGLQKSTSTEKDVNVEKTNRKNKKKIIESDSSKSSYNSRYDTSNIRTISDAETSFCVNKTDNKSHVGKARKNTSIYELRKNKQRKRKRMICTEEIDFLEQDQEEYNVKEGNDIENITKDREKLPPKNVCIEKERKHNSFPVKGRRKTQKGNMMCQDMNRQKDRSNITIRSSSNGSTSGRSSISSSKYRKNSINFRGRGLWKEGVAKAKCRTKREIYKGRVQGKRKDDSLRRLKYLSSEEENIKVKICGLDRYFKNDVNQQIIQEEFSNVLKKKRKTKRIEYADDREEEEEEEEEEKKKRKENYSSSEIVCHKRNINKEEAEFARNLLNESAEKRSDQESMLFAIEERKNDSMWNKGRDNAHPKESRLNNVVTDIKELQIDEISTKTRDNTKGDTYYIPLKQKVPVEISRTVPRKNVIKNYNRRNERNVVSSEVIDITNYQEPVPFEKLKKRAYRKYNFLSIVEITKTASDSESVESAQGKDKKKKKNEEEEEETDEDSFLLGSNDENEDSSNARKSLSKGSFFSSDSGSGGHADEPDDGYNTLDVYEYYYTTGGDAKKEKNKNVEKLSDNSKAYVDVFAKLLEMIENDEGKKESTHNTDINNSNINNKEKENTLDTQLEKSAKMERCNSKKKEILKNSVLIYQSFKNINNEVSRKNGLKAERFRNLIYDFVTNLNKKVLSIDKEQSKKEKWKNDSSSATSDVESVLNFENKSENAQLKKAECSCLFCVKNKKILSNEELHISVFKYIEAHKTTISIMKTFFMNIYIFTAFLNFALHKKNILVCNKEKNKTKKKNRWYYKFNKYNIKKYKIEKMVLFVGYSVTLTTLAIYICGVNQLNTQEKFTVVWNFFKWNKIRKNYFDTVQMKKNKNNALYTNCFFLIEAVDKYCRLKNINIEKENENKKISKLQQKLHTKKKSVINDTDIKNIEKQGKWGIPDDNVKLQQIEKALSMNLKNSNLQFLLFDPLYAACGDSFQLYPSHTIILF